MLGSLSGFQFTDDGKEAQRDSGPEAIQLMAGLGFENREQVADS